MTCLIKLAWVEAMNVGEIVGDWDYSLLPSNIQVGKDCFFERKDCFKRFRSTREPGISIGNNVQVFTWTSFNIEPNGQLEIGDGSILVGAVFMCADRISIGRRVVVSYNVTIADSDFHPHDPSERKRDAIANSPYGERQSRPQIVSRPVVIGDDVWIGIGAIVLKGVNIGNGARIAAGAVVARDVLAGSTVAGNPARQVCAYDDNCY